MQGLIAIILMLSQMSGPLTADVNNTADIGFMPEVVCTAPRYEYEDEAWSGLMPEIVCTAPRYEDEAWTGLMPEVICTAPRYEYEDEAWTGTMPEAIVVAERETSYGNDEAFTVANTAYQNYNTRTFHLDLNSKPGFAYAEDPFDVEIIIPCAKTFRGDYHLPEGDTIDEDVTVTGGNAEIDGVVDGDLAVMGGEVDINGMIDGDVAVMGGNLDIFGTISRDAAVFGGHVRNRGTIEGDLFIVGGTVSLDSGSVIEGNISMVGGTVDRDEHATVLGEIESVEVEALQKVLPRIGKAFRFPKIIPAAKVFPRLFFISLLVVVYVLNLLILLIFPKAIDSIGEKIQQNVWASVGFGIGIEILFIPLIVFFAVSIIGIPLIALLPVALTLGILFGLSALSLIFGERVTRGFNWKIETRVGLFSLGWISIMIIPIVAILIGTPIFALGAFIMYVAATIGLGGVVYALIKRKPKEVKK
ncbi:MAG: hypothetical protein JSV97_00210 [candidate division WOR-3 bacterium]|nr:MAG: hypothetical protein JSV97_00210 [candidate division WOR-3 bacterium]